MFDSLNLSVENTVENVAQTLHFTNPISEDKPSRKNHLLNQAQILLTFILIFTTPFFFLPIALDWFEPAKILFVTLVCVFAGLKLIARLFMGDKSNLVVTAVDKYLLLIPAALIASAILSANQLNQQISALLTEPVQFLALTAAFFLIVNTIRKPADWWTGLSLLSWSVILLGFLNSLQILAVQLANNITPLRNLLTSSPFLVNLNPGGSPFVLALMMVILFPLLVAMQLRPENRRRIGSTILLTLAVFSIAVMGWFLFTNRPILLDHDTARKIATGVLGHSYANALLGIGPGQFNAAFNLYRLGDFNQNISWDKNFITSSNFFFHILTIGGLITLFAFIGLITKLYGIARDRMKSDSFDHTEKALFVSLGLALVVTLFFPAAFVVLWLIYVILALLFSHYLTSNISFAKIASFSKAIQLQLCGLFVILLLVSTYGQGISTLGDIFYRQSLDAASQNRGADTYNLQLRAIQTAPWKDFYRVSISQTSLALADSLATRKNLSDQERQTVVQLVQQSLAEGRNAVALGPNNSGNWQNLAMIYRSLINFAQGSEEWAKSTETQAIALNPFDPRLRLDLGGLFFSLGDYQSAASNFAAAIQLKPDYANAHYNLAQAFKQLKINDQAIQQLQLTSQLVCAQPNGKADCDRVNNESAELSKGTEANKPAVAPTVTQPSQLATPAGQNQNLPKAKIQPPVKIASPGGELAQ